MTVTPSNLVRGVSGLTCTIPGTPQQQGGKNQEQAVAAPACPKCWLERSLSGECGCPA